MRAARFRVRGLISGLRRERWRDKWKPGGPKVSGARGLKHGSCRPATSKELWDIVIQGLGKTGGTGEGGEEEVDCSIRQERMQGPLIKTWGDALRPALHTSLKPPLSLVMPSLNIGYSPLIPITTNYARLKTTIDATSTLRHRPTTGDWLRALNQRSSGGPYLQPRPRPTNFARCFATIDRGCAS
jgi:hypothetical protein